MATVAFVTPGSFPLPSPGSSSVERVVENIAPRLQPHITSFIYGRASKKLPRRGTWMGVRCERHPAINKSEYVARIARSIRRLLPGVTVVENRPTYVLRIAQRCPGARIWLSLHSLTFVSPRHISSQRLSKCFARAERIIVNSEFLRDELARRVPSAAHKLRVVHLGVDTQRFHSQHSPQGAAHRHMVRAAQGWHDRKVVLYMGRLIPQKGVHHLLDLLPRLVAADPQVLLVIVGSPFYGSHRTTSYSRHLHKLGEVWRSHVRFVPYVPYPEVPSMFIGADIAVVPSGNNEAFGLVNVEAMACGLPVVATSAGGIREIIEDGSTGYLVQPEQVENDMYERLALLLSSEELRLLMGTRSRERVEHCFTWEHSAARWLQHLREAGL